MKDKITFIINPIAGKEDINSLVKTIHQLLDKEKFEYQIRFTQQSQHATFLAQEALNQGNDAIIAVGGDGTIHEIGKVLIGQQALLGIIPVGSANGLARHLRLPNQFDEAIKVINEFYSIKIDTGIVNQDEVMLGTAGLGFDAYIAHLFQPQKKRGFANYLKLIIKSLPSYTCHPYHLIIDGQTIKTVAFLVAIANSCQYGGGAYIAPDACINDGYLDVVIVKPFPFHAVPYLTYQLFNQKLRSSAYLQMIKCRSIQVKPTSSFSHLDGETYLSNTELNFSINPLSLNVLVPKNSLDF